MYCGDPTKRCAEGHQQKVREADVARGARREGRRPSMQNLENIFDSAGLFGHIENKKIAKKQSKLNLMPNNNWNLV